MICQWNNCKNLILMDNYCPRHLKQKCAICFEKVPSTNSAKNKRLQWFKESDECPICRKKQTSDSIIKFRNDIEDRMRCNTIS